MTMEIESKKLWNWDPDAINIRYGRLWPDMPRWQPRPWRWWRQWVAVVRVGWAGAGLGWAGAGLVCSAAVTHQISTTHTVQAGYSALSRPRLRKILPKHYLQLHEHQPSTPAASSRYATGHFQPCSPSINNHLSVWCFWQVWAGAGWVATDMGCRVPFAYTLLVLSNFYIDQLYSLHLFASYLKVHINF